MYICRWGMQPGMFFLQAGSLGPRTVVVGAFNDDGVERLLQMQDDERAGCIMPVERV